VSTTLLLCLLFFISESVNKVKSIYNSSPLLEGFQAHILSEHLLCIGAVLVRRYRHVFIINACAYVNN